MTATSSHEKHASELKVACETSHGECLPPKPKVVVSVVLSSSAQYFIRNSILSRRGRTRTEASGVGCVTTVALAGLRTICTWYPAAREDIGSKPQRARQRLHLRSATKPAWSQFRVGAIFSAVASCQVPPHSLRHGQLRSIAARSQLQSVRSGAYFAPVVLPMVESRMQRCDSQLHRVRSKSRLRHPRCSQLGSTAPRSDSLSVRARACIVRVATIVSSSPQPSPFKPSLRFAVSLQILLRSRLGFRGAVCKASLVPSLSTRPPRGHRAILTSFILSAARGFDRGRLKEVTNHFFRAIAVAKAVLFGAQVFAQPMKAALGISNQCLLSSSSWRPTKRPYALQEAPNILFGACHALRRMKRPRPTKSIRFCNSLPCAVRVPRHAQMPQMRAWMTSVPQAGIERLFFWRAIARVAAPSPPRRLIFLEEPR